MCPYIYLTIYLAVLLYADDISVLNRKLLAPGSGKYSGFQVRGREVRGSGGQKSPNEVQGQNLGMD